VKSYHSYTPVRVAIPYVTGIVLAHTGIIDSENLATLVWSVVLFLAFFIAGFLMGSNYAVRWFPGFVGCLALAALGMAGVQAVNIAEGRKDEMVRKAPEECILICRMEERPVAKTSAYSSVATIVALPDSSGRWHKTHIRVLLYFKSDSLSQNLSHGDLILISGRIQDVAGPKNPNMFNYRKYLKNRRIRWQLFIDPGNWETTGFRDANPVKFWSAWCREQFLEMLKAFRLEGDDLALASALLLGDKDLLEKDVKQEFSHAGAMHVLCVSGLHVGIMFVIAGKLLFFLQRNRKSRLVRQILILAWIWAYAFITGLTPSVIRASLMFSLLAAGRMMKRKTENFNILAGSAFIQLCMDPYEITQVGFQLSYLAVLGIFAFYQRLNGLIRKQVWPVSLIWPVLAVSMAAQASTFPLAGFYFNIFPVYFLVTNLAVVPLSGIIIYLALTLFAAGAAGLSHDWLSLPLKLAIRLLHGSVHTIQSWPNAVIEPIILQPVQVMILYLLLIGAFLLLVRSSKYGMFWVGISLILLSVTNAARKAAILQRTEITVYHVPGHTTVDFIHHKRAFFFSDSLLSENPQKVLFNIVPHRLKSGVNDISLIVDDNSTGNYYQKTYSGIHLIYFHQKTIAIIKHDLRIAGIDKRMKTDLVILTGNRKVEPDNLEAILEFDNLVTDSSVPPWLNANYRNFCLEKGIRFHSVRENGAFVLKWKIKQETRNKKQETRNKKQETRNKKQETALSMNHQFPIHPLTCSFHRSEVNSARKSRDV